MMEKQTMMEQNDNYSIIRQAATVCLFFRHSVHYNWYFYENVPT